MNKIPKQSELKRCYAWNGERPENPTRLYVLFQRDISGSYVCLFNGVLRPFDHIEEIKEEQIITKEQEEKLIELGWKRPKEELKDGDLVFAWDDDGDNAYGIYKNEFVSEVLWDHYKKVTLDEIPEEIRPMIKELM